VGHYTAGPNIQGGLADKINWAEPAWRSSVVFPHSGRLADANHGAGGRESRRSYVSGIVVVCAAAVALQYRVGVGRSLFADDPNWSAAPSEHLSASSRRRIASSIRRFR
jgi:hypothetical protein